MVVDMVVELLESVAVAAEDVAAMGLVEAMVEAVVEAAAVMEVETLEVVVV